MIAWDTAKNLSRDRQIFVGRYGHASGGGIETDATQAP